MEPYALYKYTTQIFHSGRPVATGVFICIAEKKLIISTAHQFWGNVQSDFYFSFGKDLFGFAGNHFVMNPENNEENDKDFSILEINDIIAEEIHISSFFNIEDNEIVLYNHSEKWVVGFVNHGFKISDTKLQSKPFKYGFYNLRSLNDPSFFFYITYPRRSLKLYLSPDSEPIRAHGPIPEGASGSGVWSITNEYPSLIGILLEYDDNKAEIKCLKIPALIRFYRRVKGVGY